MVGPPDAGVADNTWPLAQTHRLTTGSVQAVRLAANNSAVFGMTDHNGIWSLAAGDSAIRMIVPPGDTTVYPSDWGSRFVVSGSDLFWLDRIAGALHHAKIDGSDDQVLAAGLDGPDTLAVDDTRIYWSEVTHLQQGGGIVRSLPRNAAPGDAPVILVSVGETSGIASLVASGGAIYWTSFVSIGSTVYYASLTGASTDALLHGGSITEIDGSGPYGILAMGGEVFYGSSRDPLTTALLDYSVADGSSALLSILPIGVGLAGLIVNDEWLIVTGDSGAGPRSTSRLDRAPAW